MMLNDFQDLVHKYKLQINLIETIPENKKINTIGTICINLQKFIKDIEVETIDDKFKKGEFDLMDENNNSLGKVFLEMSQTRKPNHQTLNQKASILKPHKDTTYKSEEFPYGSFAKSNKKGQNSHPYDKNPNLERKNSNDNLYNSRQSAQSYGISSYYDNANNSKYINSGKILDSYKLNSSYDRSKVNKNSRPNKQSAVRVSYGTDYIESNPPTIREEESGDIRSEIGTETMQTNSDIRSERPGYFNPNQERPGIISNKKRNNADQIEEDSMGFQDSTKKGVTYQPATINKQKVVNNYMDDSRPDDSISYSITNVNFQNNKSKISNANQHGNMYNSKAKAPTDRPEYLQSSHKKPFSIAAIENSQDYRKKEPAIKYPEHNPYKKGVKTTLSIEEMAKGYYCPPPMFYFKQETTEPAVDNSKLNKEFKKDIGIKFDENNGTIHQVNVNAGNNRGPARQNYIDEPLQSLSEPQNNNVQNIIQLNSDETKKLLTDKQFQLNIDGNNMLLDILQNELVNLRKQDGLGKSTPDNVHEDFQKNFKMIVEHHNLGDSKYDIVPRKHNTYKDPYTTSLDSTKPKETKVNFKKESEEKYPPKLKKGSHRDVYDVGASQSKGDMSKYPQESIKEKPDESLGKESTIKESWGKNSDNSSDLYNRTRNLTDSQKRASTKYEDDFEDQSMSMSRSTNVVDYNKNHKPNKFSTMTKDPKRNTAMSQYSGIEEDFDDDFESETMSKHKTSMVSDLKKHSLSKPKQNNVLKNKSTMSYSKQDSRISLSMPTIVCEVCNTNVPIDQLTDHITLCSKRNSKGNKKNQGASNNAPKNDTSLLEQKKTSKFYTGSRESYPDDFTGSYSKYYKSKDSMKNSGFGRSESKTRTEIFDDDFEDD